MNHVLNFNKWAKLNEEEGMDAMMSMDMANATSAYPKPGETVSVNVPGKGFQNMPVPTDSATLGMASKIIGTIMAATGGVDNNAKVQKAVYEIRTPQLYYACLWMVAHSPNVKAHYGFNFSLIGNMLGQDMTFAAGQGTGTKVDYETTTSSVGAAVQNATGYGKMYGDIVRHLKQFNENETLPTETFADR
jgi:hypothetical protein